MNNDLNLALKYSTSQIKQENIVDKIELALDSKMKKPFQTMAFIPEINSQFNRILVVDDEPYNLIGLKIVIEAACPHLNITNIIDSAVNG